jgi:hypothetical protein
MHNLKVEYSGLGTVLYFPKTVPRGERKRDYFTAATYRQNKARFLAAPLRNKAIYYTTPETHTPGRDEAIDPGDKALYLRPLSRTRR